MDRTEATREALETAVARLKREFPEAGLSFGCIGDDWYVFTRIYVDGEGVRWGGYATDSLDDMLARVQDGHLRRYIRQALRSVSQGHGYIAKGGG